ncbi:MAG: bifunctional glutamate N-acetyltransferase/amino-acid acetyltransferase ArgJ [Gammaproteobacteria bacterium]|nr:bifunctional glutamate N-acetyltransferase/amino-acid acetyltransferase ArgJ [Gammaproteobacteria bacterium]
MKLLPVKGIRLGTVEAGIRYADQRDLVVIEIAKGAHCAAVFTRNVFCAAPVQLARAHLQQTLPRYLLVNTGNANAGTGDQGLLNAEKSCEVLAQLVTCTTQQVLPFSTGVIGEQLPISRLEAGIQPALNALDVDGWEAAAHGILTTDTVAKACSRQMQVNGRSITLTGIAKGSGMIRPDMATMLSFIATDADIEINLLQDALHAAVDQSFNRITVDGDTSTNDSCVLMATGCSGVGLVAGDAAWGDFCRLLVELCVELAQAIVRDGEGATKFVTVTVAGGADSAECLAVADAIAHSPLVKTALFASDPNWGRILAAVGRADVDGLDIATVDLYLGNVRIIRGGDPDPDYSEEQGQHVMSQNEITIRVELGRGEVEESMWTCDFSYDYVRINAEYRS